MEDYAELAARVAAGVGGLRGCLILSRHGLVLGAHPEGDESVAKPSWLRFALLGEPERSFVEFADQVWVYVHRGPYAAFAIADAGVRPGLLIDQLEQALLTAEESRTRREGMRTPEVAGTSAAGPRTPLHPAAPSGTPADAPVVVPVAAGAEWSAEPATVWAGEPPRQDPPPPVSAAEPHRQDPPPPVSAAEPHPDRPPASPNHEVPESPNHEVPEPPKHEAPKLMTTPVTPERATHEEDEAEVDKVMLAQEFGGLLQELGSDDEATS